MLAHELGQHANRDIPLSILISSVMTLGGLANQNIADADPEPWVEWLLYSHPALGKRRVVLPERSIGLVLG